jgi:hypothetical protein
MSQREWLFRIPPRSRGLFRDGPTLDERKMHEYGPRRLPDSTRRRRDSFGGHYRKCFAFAPTAAANELVFGCRAEGRSASRSPAFDNEIRFIANKLSIYAKDGTERGFHLLIGIIWRSQSAGGERN